MQIVRHVFESQNDWANIRKGLFTASRIGEIMANGRKLMNEQELAAYKLLNPKSTAKYMEDETVLSDGAITYILEIIQGLEGAPKPQFYNAAMEWGNEQEPQAILRYCNDYGFDLNADDVIYTSVGGIVFFVGDDILGCTPDLILHNKLVQVKCPDSKTHLEYKLFLTEANFKEREPKYYWQMQLEMMLGEKEESDFYSFDPRFTREAMQAHKVPVKANKEDQSAIYRKAVLCEKQKQIFINQLK